MDVIIRTLAYSTDICETAINLSYKEKGQRIIII